MSEQKAHIVLPEQLSSSLDISRALRELKALDDSLHQANLRKPGEPTKIVSSSPSLEELARLNAVTLINAKHRVQLIEMLTSIHAHAPRVYMSVAAEPSRSFITTITNWFRKSVHPLALLEIGLQPTLAAGCIVRTTNRQFDLSLRNHFKENRVLLAKKMGDVF